MKIGDVEITYSPVSLHQWRATLGDISVVGRTRQEAIAAMIEALAHQIRMLPREEEARVA